MRALEPVPAGSFVMEYAGEVIDEKELAARMAAAAACGEHHYYIMELSGGLFIDARSRANAARFLNSSCAPNCETQKWFDAATGEARRGSKIQAELALPRCRCRRPFPSLSRASRKGPRPRSRFSKMCKPTNLSAPPKPPKPLLAPDTARARTHRRASASLRCARCPRARS